MRYKPLFGEDGFFLVPKIVKYLAGYGFSSWSQEEAGSILGNCSEA